MPLSVKDAICEKQKIAEQRTLAYQKQLTECIDAWLVEPGKTSSQRTVEFIRKTYEPLGYVVSVEKLSWCEFSVTVSFPPDAMDSMSDKPTNGGK